MSMERSSTSPLYAAIDLGSNSFHMWVVREVDGHVQTLAKIKRKVRLAAGLNSNNELSLEAMQRGWDCLSLFAERLQDIPSEHVRIVGTAALRTAVNADEFLAKAKDILGYAIAVILVKKKLVSSTKELLILLGGATNVLSWILVVRVLKLLSEQVLRQTH